ncbi:MAG: hypothetical protein WC475_03215, partial [Candidatus Paceibacterota bacterium]
FYIDNMYSPSIGATADIIFTTTSTERMRINSSGNVGIGTADPTYLLEVNGTLRANDFYSGDGTQGLTNSTSYWLCADSACTTKCQVTIKDGFITGCP